MLSIGSDSCFGGMNGTKTGLRCTRTAAPLTEMSGKSDPVNTSMSLDLMDEVVQRLSAARKPVSYAALSKALVKKSRGISDATLREAISSAVNEGRAFHWGSYARSSQCYWTTSRDQWLSRRIVEQCSAIAQIQSQVKVRGVSDTAIRAAMNELIGAGKLQRYPGIGQEKVRIGASPQAYAAALREFVVKKLEKSNIPQDVFFSSPDETAVVSASMHSSADSHSSEAVMAERILETLPKLERPGLPVASVVLRRSLGIGDTNKREFDGAVMQLSNQRRIYLSAHHDAHGLAAADRDNLIDGGEGRYYVALTLLTES